MSEEEDFSKLPIEARWRHSKWKARQSAYDDVIADLKQGSPKFQPSVEDLKLCASDSNVIALESGIRVITAVLQSLPAESNNAVAIRQAVARPLAEKGLVAAKPAVKQATIESFLTLVEVADPAGVVEDILGVVATAKSPKALAAAVQTLDSIFKDFGSPVTDPRPVLKDLGKLFGHTDRNVRQNATSLACTLSRWVGEPALLQILSGIKPVQLNELKACIAKADFSASPQRLTRQQQLEQQNNDLDEMNDDADAAQNGGARGAHGSNAGGSNAAEIDPWDLAEPEDIVPRIPSEFWELLSSAKWKERHEALDSVVPMLEKAQKLEPSADYSRLVNELLRVAQKDMNQMCATQAVQGLGALALGLRSHYSQYAPRTLEVVVERFKEKKQSAIDVVSGCIDSVFFHVINCQFTPLMETVVDIGMKHKTPQVRIESTKYCASVLCKTPVVPKFADVQALGKVAVKLLGDTSEPMRASAAGVLAALVKIVGAAKMAPIMDPLDDHKKKRVSDAVEKTTVAAKGANASTSSSRPAAPAAAGARASSSINSTTKPAITVRSTAGGNSALRPAANSNEPKRAGLRPNPASHSQSLLHPRLNSTASGAAPHSGRQMLNAASPPSRRAPVVGDLSMGLTSPSPLSHPSQRSGRPSLSSTPKMVKRTSTNADFTPARGVDPFRRRIISPAKPQDASGHADEAEIDVGEIARLSAELELEKSLRLDAEKRLARVQVEKDREILRLQEEASMLKLQLKTQKEEFEVWLKNKEQRWSQASLSSDDMGNKLSVLSLDSNPLEKPTPSSRPPSRRPPSRVLPISSTAGPALNTPVNTTAVRTGNEDWERAVSMTHSLRQRVEQLKQQKQRNLIP